jgi:hypothetical protein
VTDELSAALQRLELAMELGVRAADIVEKKLPVPEAHRARLVGRQGA